MGDIIGTGGPLAGYTPDYVRRLLIERRYIYAKILNPGGSVILRASDIVDHDRPVGYSTEIGNTFHLDLIELEQKLQELVDEGLYTKKEIMALMSWADGMTAQQAADYIHARGSVSAGSVRQLRKRGLRKLQERLDAGNRTKSRGTSNADAESGREETKNDTVQGRDNRRKKKKTYRQQGNTDVET